jgi:hypothetical protein
VWGGEGAAQQRRRWGTLEALRWTAGAGIGGRGRFSPAVARRAGRVPSGAPRATLLI